MSKGERGASCSDDPQLKGSETGESALESVIAFSSLVSRGERGIRLKS